MLIRDLLNEVNRELALRKQVFPRLIRDGRLSPGEAEERNDRLQVVANVLLWILKQGTTQTGELQHYILRPVELNKTVQDTQKDSIIKGGGQ